MITPPPLTLAFIGCGAITRKHSRTLRAIAPATRLVYASRDGARAQQFMRELAGAGAYDSYARAMDDPQVDVVLIATPPSSHLELTLAALAAGKHVIVEKPPFLRAADVDAVALAARTANRQVCVAENYAYKPVLARLRALVTSGALGDVRFVQINALKKQRTGDWRDDHATVGGGALFEGGIHWVAFMASLGLPVSRASGIPVGPVVPLERSAFFALQYKGGALGTLHYSWEIPTPLKGLRWSKIFGTEGTATFESNGIFVSVSGKRPSLSFPGLKDIVGTRAMFADFLAAVRDNRAARYGLDEARRDLSLIEQAYAPAAAGA